MFFEPPPARPEPVDPGRFDLPPWAVPPALELGAVVGLERVVARSANVVIVLPTIRAFRTGCRFDVEVVGRQGTLLADEWWTLLMSGPTLPRESREGGRLSDKLLRLGVRYASGAKATTLEPDKAARSQPAEPPAGPVLSWVPGGSGGGRHAGGDYMFHHFGLWLWPLPSPERIDFAVEWPFGGIDLTMIDIDGAAIVSAAERAAPYWPDSSDR
jgi:hypothetical protein